MMVQYGSTALFLNYITDSDRAHPITGIQWHSRTILDSYRRQKAGHVAANMNILTVAQQQFQLQAFFLPVSSLQPHISASCIFLSVNRFQ